MRKKVVALGGDGIGPEVVAAACYVLEHAGFEIELAKPVHGKAALDTTGTAFPDSTKRLCETADAVIFGAAGGYSEPILAYLRWQLDNYVNIRPIKYYDGAKSCLNDPQGIDFVILRENSEGLYSFFEGDLNFLAGRLPDVENLFGRKFVDFGPGRFAVRIVSEQGSRRLAKFACEYALSRKKRRYPGKVTCVGKSNVLFQTCGLFERVIQEEVAKHIELSYERYYVDDAARRLLRYPQEFDVIVTSNMFGDILSDMAAELVGGLGMIGSACVGGKIPYFEPVHGSAPKYAGKNVANPTGALQAIKLMLEYFGMDVEAARLDAAVAAVYRSGRYLTHDQGGKTTTMEFAEAVLRALGS